VPSSAFAASRVAPAASKSSGLVSSPPGTWDSTPIAVSLSMNTSFSIAPLEKHSMWSAFPQRLLGMPLKASGPAFCRHAPFGFTWCSCTSKMNSSPPTAAWAAASSNGASGASA
jgi:hypothetical protein